MPSGTVTPVTASGASALTLIGSSVAAATAASFSFTGISASFHHLRLVLNARCDNPGGAGLANMHLNGDSGANYDFMNLTGLSGGAAIVDGAAATAARIVAVSGTTAPAGSSGMVEITIPNYTGTTFFKTWSGFGGRKDSDVAAGLIVEDPWGTWRNTAAVTAVQIVAVGTSGTAQNFIAGSSAFLYGIT